LFLIVTVTAALSKIDIVPQQNTHNMNVQKNLGLLLLAIYLILVGITMLFHTIAIPVVVMGILALAAGVLILIGR
jgi:uncharacterized membrane protein HdeD (DUF308 family)